MVFLDQIEYPAEVFYQLSLSLVPLVIASYLWLAVYQNGRIIGSFNLSSMITYYLVVMILDRLLAHPAFWISDMVETGELSGFLIKPFHFLKYVFLHSLVRRIVNLIISSPIVIIAFFLLSKYLISPPDILVFLLFLASIFLSIVIFYLLGILLGLISLWTFEIGSIFYFYYASLGFLGGAMLPLSFFPSTLANVSNFLPFKYLYFFPAQIYLGKVSYLDIFIGFIGGFLWIGIIYLTLTLIWSIGLRRYSSFGG